jgi:hypothetical protein
MRKCGKTWQSQASDKWECNMAHALCMLDNLTLMKPRFVVTQTNRQTEIPALLESLVTNTPSVKMYPQKTLPLLFLWKHDLLQCWSVTNLSSFSVFCKSMYRFVTTNLSFMSIRLQTRTQNTSYLLHLQGNNSYAKASQCFITSSLHVLLWLTSKCWKNKFSLNTPIKRIWWIS